MTNDKKYECLLSLAPFNGTSDELLYLGNKLEFDKDDIYVGNLMEGVWSGFPACCIRSYTFDGKRATDAKREYKDVYGHQEEYEDSARYVRCLDCIQKGTIISKVRTGNITRDSDGVFVFLSNKSTLELMDLMVDLENGLYTIERGGSPDLYGILKGDITKDDIVMSIDKGIFDIKTMDINTNDMKTDKFTGYYATYWSQGVSYKSALAHKKHQYYELYSKIHSICESKCKQKSTG